MCMKQRLHPGKLLTLILLVSSQWVVYGQPWASGKEVSRVLPQEKPQQKTLKTVLGDLETHYQVSFGYLDHVVDDKFVPAAPWQGRSLEDVLEAMLTPLDLHFFKVKDGFYLIRPNARDTPAPQARIEASASTQTAPVVPMAPAPAAKETHAGTTAMVINITGVVRDAADNSPIPGVNVLVKGTANGTTTGVDGRYRMSVDDENAILVFSFIGYQPMEVPINGRSTIDVSLSVDVQELAEVVVVGYGTVKKKDLTGAVAVMDSEQLTKRGSVNAMEAMQGQVAGVDISNGSGRAGAGFNIQIRGQQSIKGGEPLYVVDGVITDGIDFLNPQDIERIDILKDASSTAIYGSRGAYGVVLVTTRQGASAKKKAVISYDGYYGVKAVARLPDFMDGTRWMDWRIDSYTSASLVSHVTPNPEAAFNTQSDELHRRLDERDFTDWGDLVLQDGRQQNHWVSLSGMSDHNLGYNVGFGYQQEEGNIINENYERYNFKMSVNHTLNDHWQGGANLNLAVINFDQGAPNAMQNAFRMNPLMKPYDTDDGEVIVQPGKDYIGDSRNQYHINFTSSVNPLVDMANSHQRTRTYYAIGNVFLQYSPLGGLSFKTMFAPRFKLSRYGLYEGTNSEGRVNARPGAEIRNSEAFSYVWDNQVMYDKAITPDHHISAMGLVSANLFRNDSSQIRDEFIDMSAIDFYNVGLNSDKDVVTLYANYSKETILSYALRFNYAYRDRYLVTLSTRWDGASVLSDGNKWDNFPSAAFAWRLSDESFMQEVTWLNDLKARISYGITGNKVVDPYKTLALANRLTYYDFGGNTANGIVQGQLANKLLSWEKTREVDIGLDFSLFTGRVVGSVDFYNKRSKDLILDRQLPLEEGFAEVTQNIAEVSNKGVEIALTTVNVSTDQVTWSTSFNFARNKNEVLSVYENSDFIIEDRGDGYDEDDYIQVGQPLGSYYNYQADGVWHADEADEASGYGQTEGQGRVKDFDGNGSITPEDRRFLGSRLPKWTAGLSTVVTYKAFDLSASLVTRQGVFVYSPFHAEFTNPQDRGRGKLDVDWYMQENIVGPTRNTSNFQPQPRNPGVYWTDYKVGYYRDADFVKVKNITLGYTFQQAMLDRLKLSKLRIYTTVQNPFVFTDYDGMDPEWAHSNFTQGGVSTIVYQFGVNLQF